MIYYLKCFKKYIDVLVSESSIATLIFALIGKLAVAGGFKGLYQLTIEIFPTVARNAGFGSCSCVARIGGMLAPLVADLVRKTSAVKIYTRFHSSANKTTKKSKYYFFLIVLKFNSADSKYSDHCYFKWLPF